MKAGAWQVGSLVFFGYILMSAVGVRGLRRAARLRTAAGAAGGAMVIAVSTWLPADGIANVWILPPIALLAGYWTSGRLFVSPMPRVERLLPASMEHFGSMLSRPRSREPWRNSSNWPVPVCIH